MVENKKQTIGYSVIAALMGMLVALGGVNYTDDDVYYCEDKGLVMGCDHLSKYYSLDNGKCWSNNEAVGNKLCRTGWLLIEDDSRFQALDVSKQSGNQEVCNSEGCVPIE